MCYYRKGTKASTLQVAKEDIICWKTLDGQMKSEIRGFQYELGKTYGGFRQWFNLNLDKLWISFLC